MTFYLKRRTVSRCLTVSEGFFDLILTLCSSIADESSCQVLKGFKSQGIALKEPMFLQELGSDENAFASNIWPSLMEEVNGHNGGSKFLHIPSCVCNKSGSAFLFQQPGCTISKLSLITGTTSVFMEMKSDNKPHLLSKKKMRL